MLSTNMPHSLKFRKFRVPGEVWAGGLIWLELHTGSTLIIDLFVAIMMTGGIFYTLYAHFINRVIRRAT